MKYKTLATAILLTLIAPAAVFAADAAGPPIKIALISDMTDVYANIDGPASVEAMRMAIEEFGGTVLGRQVEVISGDHQNNADAATAMATKFFDKDNVTMLIGGTNSTVARAMNKVAAAKKRVYMVVGAGSTALTNEECTPYTVHYAYDTYSLAKSTGSEVVRRGGKSWFFITADYSFGSLLQSDATKVLESKGGNVVGFVKHPLGATDFTDVIKKANASPAQVIAFANAGNDTVNAIRTAGQPDYRTKKTYAALLMFINDVHGVGLKSAEGLLSTDSWYWDRDDASRKFAKRFYNTFNRMPSSLQAADYSATLAYLNAVKIAGTTDSTKVMATLKATPINDSYQKGYIRKDGKFMHDMYLLQVKSPAESKKPWDYMKIIATTPGDQAFMPLSESKCSLAK